MQKLACGGFVAEFRTNVSNKHIYNKSTFQTRLFNWICVTNFFESGSTHFEFCFSAELSEFSD